MISPTGNRNRSMLMISVKKEVISMLNCMAVGIGGFIGSVLRYLVSLIPIKTGEGFPVNTLMINIAGAFLIGMLVGFFARTSSDNSSLMLMLKVGICGGFTTFSTFSLDTVELIKTGNWTTAFAYIFLSIILCISAVFCGQAVAK